MKCYVKLILIQQLINFVPQMNKLINNIDNSQSNPTISNQATTVKVPDAVRSGESTFGFTAAAMMS